MFEWLVVPLRFAFMVRGLTAAIAVGVLCSAVGAFVVLRGMTFIGDALAHSILPGLADRIREYLEARGEVTATDPMFASTRNTRASRVGARVARRTVQQICAKYYGKADVTGRAHTLRHTAATLALKNGADLLQVQAMLRHTDSKTTARYAHALNRVEENPALRIPVECG